MRNEDFFKIFYFHWLLKKLLFFGLANILVIDYWYIRSCIKIIFSGYNKIINTDHEFFRLLGILDFTYIYCNIHN